jgi:hypothetical protein
MIINAFCDGVSDVKTVEEIAMKIINAYVMGTVEEIAMKINDYVKRFCNARNATSYI